MLVELLFFWLFIYAARIGLNYSSLLSFNKFHKSFEGFELSMFQMAYSFSISFITSWLKHENGRLRIFLSYWFNFGSAFMCLGVLVSPYFLWVSVFNLISVFSFNYLDHKIYDSEVNIVETSAIITPIIPGICFKAITIKLYFT